MANYGHIIFFSLIGGVFSLAGGLLLLSKKRSAESLATYATPFAAGALLAAVFLDLLREGLEEAEADTVLISALVGIVIFYFAERFLHWFHHHHQHERQSDPGRSLIVIGDTVHNALDGIAIAAAFLISVPTGIVTTLAVAAHEIPQEIGDVGLLLSKGMTRRKVLLVNILSAFATTLFAILTFALGSEERLPTGVLLGLSAGFLLYIALSDIIPELHESTVSKRFLSWQPVLLLLGAVVVGVSVSVSHGLIEPGHDRAEPHDRSGYEIADHAALPQIASLTVRKDAVAGYNLTVETKNFTFAPEAVGEGVKAGEGYALVYINDQEMARMYGAAVYLENAQVGDTIRVTLNVNDHREIIHDDAPVAADIIVEEQGSHKRYFTVGDTEDHGHPH